VIPLTISTTTIANHLHKPSHQLSGIKNVSKSSSFCSTKELQQEKFLFIDLLENIIADHRKPALSERFLGFKAYGHHSFLLPQFAGVAGVQSRYPIHHSSHWYG
jgi:hypothetical protein